MNGSTKTVGSRSYFSQSITTDRSTSHAKHPTNTSELGKSLHITDKSVFNSQIIYKLVASSYNFTELC